MSLKTDIWNAIKEVKDLDRSILGIKIKESNVSEIELNSNLIQLEGSDEAIRDVGDYGAIRYYSVYIDNTIQNDFELMIED